MSESVASEVVSAMVGGMFSASALYPLEVLKTRMQAESKSTTSSKNNEDNKKDLPNEQEPNDGEEEDETKHTKQLTYEEAASQGMKSYAKLMYDNEGGIAPFYAGVVTSAVQSATEKALYFFAYTFYKNG